MVKLEKISAPLSVTQEKGWQFLRGGLPHKLSETDARALSDTLAVPFNSLQEIFSRATLDLKELDLKSYTLLELNVYKDTPKQRCRFIQLDKYSYEPILWVKYTDNGYGFDTPANFYIAIAYCYLQNNDVGFVEGVWRKLSRDFEKRPFIFDLFFYFIKSMR